jgi:Xaa-Pro aminopeptidase
VHEPPFMGAYNDYMLAPDSIITAERGIYIPKWGGIRIEDQVRITGTGCENLISATKQLIEL